MEIQALYPEFEEALVNELKQLPVMEIDAGMEIPMHGNVASHIPLGVEGSVRVFGRDSEGHEADLYEVKPGVACIVSFTSAMIDTPAITYAMAKQKSKIIPVPKELSNTWFVKYTSWRQYIIGLYQNRLDELIKQNERVVAQKEMIEIQKNQIIQSINYARNIQKAVLPVESQLKDFFADYFILYIPKDIVSGDFYWTYYQNDKVFFAAADATGHGVQGAFMSMLGISLMNEICYNFSGNAADFLNTMRNKTKEALKQTSFDSGPRDGFDLQLCIFHTRQGIVEYAGANNNLLLSRNNQIFEFNADKMPVGVAYKEEKPFTNHSISVQDNDIFYLFSDGYKDQFGGTEQQKFSKKRFYNLLSQISSKPLTEQKEILEKKFHDWKGSNTQVDDVLVMGIKIRAKE